MAEKVYVELDRFISPGASDMKANLLDEILSYTGCLGTHFIVSPFISHSDCLFHVSYWCVMC